MTYAMPLRSSSSVPAARAARRSRANVRRRCEVIEELAFVIETDDFPAVVARLQRYGGRTPLISSGKDNATFSLSSGVLLRVQLAGTKRLGPADGGLHRLEGAPEETDGRDGQACADCGRPPSRPSRSSTEHSVYNSSNPNCAKGMTKSSAPLKTPCRCW